MASADPGLSQLDGPLVWAGYRQLVPISLFVIVFGMAFGLAATQEGLNGLSTVAMSALVFAGASQFAALELWGPELPLFTVLITVFAINSRHLLMGATLYPWLRQLPRGQRYGIMMVASDANWAMAMMALHRGRPGLGILFGGGLAIWTFWVTGSWLGLYIGGAVSDPEALGLDMVMGCFLLAMVFEGERNQRMLVIWIMAGAASLLAFRFLPENSHVVTGAMVGGLVGLLWSGGKDGR